MRTLLSSALVMLALGASPLVAHADAASTSRHEVRLFSDGSVVAGASANLTRTDTGISLSLATSQLPPGDVVTVWWVVFNHPESCSGPGPGHPFQCGPSDLSNPAVAASVLYAAGHVIGGSGAAGFGAHLSVGDTSGALFGPGLLLPRTANVHLLLRACNTTCTNVQFAHFE